MLVFVFHLRIFRPWALARYLLRQFFLPAFGLWAFFDLKKEWWPSSSCLVIPDLPSSRPVSCRFVKWEFPKKRCLGFRVFGLSPQDQVGSFLFESHISTTVWRPWPSFMCFSRPPLVLDVSFRRSTGWWRVRRWAKRYGPRRLIRPASGRRSDWEFKQDLRIEWT